MAEPTASRLRGNFPPMVTSRPRSVVEHATTMVDQAAGVAVVAASSDPALARDGASVAQAPTPDLRDPDREEEDLSAIRARVLRSARVDVVAMIAADLAALIAATVVGLVALAAVTGTKANSVSRLSHNLWLNLPMPAVVVAVFAAYGLYRQRRRRFVPRGFHDIGLFSHAVVAGAFATLGVGVMLHRLTGRPEVVPAQLLAITLAVFVAVPVGRGSCRMLLSLRPSIRTRVVIVGSGLVTAQVRQHLEHDRGVEIVGLVDDDPAPGTDILGSTADIASICRKLSIDRVLVTFSRSHPSETIAKLRTLHGSVAISIIPRYFELMSYRSQIDEIDGLPMIDVAPKIIGPVSRFAKRSLDIVGSFLSLCLLSPLLGLACVAIKVSSRGSILFGQTRIGRDGHAFTMWKLRTMRTGAELERAALADREGLQGDLFKLRDDPRIFPLGRFLRRTSIDEIPQLVNVLRGEMSLVGPRPFIPEEAKAFEGWAARRFEMRPGITGLWQVSGRSDLSHDQLQQLDYLYVASWSLLWDIRILWKTPAVVMRKRGAY